MSMFKRGMDAVESASQKNVDLKKVFIRLKDGESAKVRFLGAGDYVEYVAHANGFNYGLYTQPCKKPLGVECPICKMYESGLEKLDKGQKYSESEYYDLRPSKRYLIAMVDLEEDMLKVWDCSKTQFLNFISQLEDYSDMITDGEECYFTLKRTGAGTSTAYNLAPIMNTKKNAQLLEKLKPIYDKYEGQEVEDSFFESVLQVKEDNVILEALDKGGVNIKEVYQDYSPSNDSAPIVEEADDDDVPF